MPTQNPDGTVDYMDLVNERIKKAVLDNYANTPAFTTDFDALKSSLGITDANWNNYMRSSVAAGVSPEVALELFVFTLSMK